MGTTKRTRNKKVHVWTNPSVLARFDAVLYRLGLSRDGGFECAMLLYLGSHEGAHVKSHAG